MVKIEKDAYKSFVVMVDEEEVVISEGDKVEFVSEFTGEKKVGTITKISGKGDKTKIQIMPVNSQCEEVWSITVIAEDSLKLFEEE